MVVQRLGYVIKRTQQTLRQRMDSSLASMGITTPQYAALSMLEKHPGLSNAALARKCFLTPQTMHQIVTALEGKGLIERNPDPSHGRKINTRLTDQGRETLSEAHQIVTEIESEMTQPLSNKEIEQIITNLEQCIKSMETN